MPFVENNLVMYIVDGVPVVPAAAAAAGALQQGVGGTAGFLDVLAAGSKIIGKVVTVNADPVTYNVQFGPVGNEGEPVAPANAALQILNIPEAALKKITMLNNITVAGVGGSRKRRQSKKRKNHKNHNNNQ
jgi:hypothetical protein